MSGTLRAPKTTLHLEQLRGIIQGQVAPPPVAQLIGLRLISVDLGRCVMELEASARHANPMGTLHGGVICDLADLAMGSAMASTLEDDESFTTLDLTSKFFKPVWNARLEAVAQVTRRTRTLGFVECAVTDDSGSLVAKVFSTCMVLRAQEAAGR
jgi:uncharacterized protein (TIGR00369 family)